MRLKLVLHLSFKLSWTQGNDTSQTKEFFKGCQKVGFEPAPLYVCMYVLLMYIVASPDPNPRGGGQLPNPNECNSTLKRQRGERRLPLTLRVQFYANEWN